MPVYGKCEYLNPAGSGKDRIALAILNDAEQRGQLLPGDTLIEATAGNTGLGLAFIAAQRGYKLVCVMPEKMSVDKRQALTAAGAEIIIAENAPLTDERNFQNVALKLARERGWFHTNQFANPVNVQIHERTTGPEILEQCNGSIGLFVCGVGTGGTITGVGKFLKQHVSDVRILLADPIGSGLAQRIDPRCTAVDTPYIVEGIGSSAVPAICDLSVIDAVEQVSDEASFYMTGRLIREEKAYVGGSSGTALAAALQFAGKEPLAGPIVVLFADSYDRYLSKAWMKEYLEDLP